MGVLTFPNPGTSTWHVVYKESVAKYSGNKAGKRYCNFGEILLGQMV